MAQEGGSSDPMDDLRQQVADVQNQLNMMGPALKALAGLENVGAGISQIVEVLQPLRSLAAPPEPPDGATVAAIDRMLTALEVKAFEAAPAFGEVTVPASMFTHIGRERTPDGGRPTGGPK